MKTCPLCSGKLVSRKITYPQEYDGKVVILENVPAEVCQQCGDVLVNPDVLKKIQKNVWSGVKAKRSVNVPVYDLTDVA